MNFPDGLLGIGWVSFGLFVYAISMVWALRTAPWYKVKADRGAQHVLLGAALLIVLLWNFSASIGDGFSFHFLFMTVATLMFGPQFALMAMSLGLLGVTLNGEAGWMSFGINAMLMGWLPIMVTWWMYKLAYRYLDKNFFVYTFLNGFLAAGIGSVMALMLAAGIMLASGAYVLEDLQYNFLPFIPMIAAPEAFLNGFVIAGLVLMKPEWVSTFHDHLYLNGK
jgi:uncharacterized membrane protein